MSPSDPPRRQLNSWKEVGAFLGVAPRTAQRWERERGLPVRRLDGEKGRIVADTAALAEWKRRAVLHAGPWGDTRFLRRYAVASTALAVVAAGGLLAEVLLVHGTGPPVSTRPEFKSLVVSDARGHELWRYQFPDVLGAEGYYSAAAGRSSWIGDIDGDGQTEVLFSYLPTTAGKTGTALYCFSATGRLKWRFEPGRAVSDASGAAYDRVYIITDWIVWRAGGNGPMRIAVASQHSTYYPCQVAVLDGTGRLAGEYWHSGHLDYLDVGDVDGDGRPEIVLVGVNNGFRAASLVVLDPDRVSGASDQRDDPHHQIAGFPPAREKRVVRFPRTCINRALGLYNQAKMVRIENHTVLVRVQEVGDDPTGAVFYTLDRSFTVTAVALSDTLKNLHRQLEKDGKLDHTLRQDEIDGLRELANHPPADSRARGQ